MKKLLVLVGLFTALSIIPATQAYTDISYCVNPITTSDVYYRLTQDINFSNASSYPSNACFFTSPTSYDNVTIDLNGFSIHVNSTAVAWVLYVRSISNFTLKNGIINYTSQGGNGGTAIYSSAFASYPNTDNTYSNITVIAGTYAVRGLFILGPLGRHFNLTVEDSSFTGFVTYDIDLTIPQSEITSCGNTYNTFRVPGSLLSKDSCSDPPPSPSTYKDYIRQVNCTMASSAAYGSLVCSNEIKIPADCVNITTEAWTVIVPYNETWLNQNLSFTRWTCNPEGDRTTHCDNLYKTCEYYNFNAYPLRRWDDYAAGQNATSFHIASIPQGCLENQEGGKFNMTGRLQMSCKSFTESGIEIDGESEDCEHGMYCFNSGTMEERFTDCTSILTPCPFGCVEGVCLSVATTTLPRGTDQQPLIDLSPYGAGAWVSMLFTPFTIITMMLVGIGAYFENQVKDSKGGIFLAVIIIGVLGFTYLGIYPSFIGILIAIVCAGILSKFVLQLW